MLNSMFRYDRRLVDRANHPRGADAGFLLVIRAAATESSQKNPPVAGDTGLRPAPAGAAAVAVYRGSRVAGQGDRAAAAARVGARLRVLGILRFRIDHDQSLGFGVWRRVSGAVRLRQVLLRIRRGVGGGGGGLDRRAVRAPLRSAAGM